MNDYFSESKATLQRVCQVLEQNDLKYLDLGERGFGVGVGIAFGPHEFVVLSVGGQTNSHYIYLTTGLLRDVNQDRLGLLTLCNNMTNDNPAFPTILHDADAGWDILVQQTHPAQLMVDVPAFFVANVKALAANCADWRGRFAEIGAGGQPYAWENADIERLFVRSLL